MCTSLHPDRNKGHYIPLVMMVKAQIKKDDILLCDKTDSSVTNKVPRTLLELWLPHWNSAVCSPSIPCYELELTSNLVYCWQTAMIDNLFKF